MKKSVAVVGAGVAGLAAAARLARRGFDVDVYEKLPECGGRAHMIEDRGFKFDTGPSFVLMPDFFQEFFADMGSDLKDHLDLRVLEENYRIFFDDGQKLTIHRDNELTARALEAIEPGASVAYRAFLAETQRIYGATRPFLLKAFSARDLVSPSIWPLATRLRAFSSWWQLAKKYFQSEKLRFVFTFEAMFMGVSPFEAPAFYSIISYADHVQKIFHPMGGMYEIPKALERLGRSLGVRYHYGSEVKKIAKPNGAFELSLPGASHQASRVVVNADYVHAQRDLLGRRVPSYRYSCSVYLVYLGLKKKARNLAHHNLFFARDLHLNLRDIFTVPRLPQDPSFYVHAPTVTDPSLAPADKEILYLLIPVPNLETRGPLTVSEERNLKAVAYKKINQVIGEKVEDLIEVEHRFYPQDFVTRYNIPHGATFGLAHTLMQSAFFRPHNADRQYRGLYYVGASTQPGGGLPPVLASSRIVADLIEKEAF